MIPEYRRRRWRLWRACQRGQLQPGVYCWLLATLIEQQHSWRWN